MGEKSKASPEAKKQGRTLKEKRAAKNEKQASQKQARENRDKK